MNIRRLHVLWKFWIPILLLIVGIASSISAFIAARTIEDRRVHDYFDFRADWRAAEMRNGLEDHFASVGAAATLIRTWPVATAEAFARFARAENSRTRHQPRAVFWAPRVLHADRAAFEAAARARGMEGYAIVEPDVGQPARFAPAAARPEYYPLLLAAEIALRGTVLGTDAGFDDDRRSAIQHAIDSGRMTISGIGPRVGRGDDRTIGFTVYVPVYESAEVAADVASRRALARGVVGGSYDLAQVLNRVIEDSPPIAGAIYLVREMAPADTTASVFAAYDSAGRQFAVGRQQLDLASLAGYRTTRSIRIAGEPWHLVFHFPPHLVAALRTSGPAMWLVAGVLLTLSVSGVVFATQSNMIRLRRVLDAKTEDFTRLDDQLQVQRSEFEAIIRAAPLAIIALNRAGVVRTWSPAAERIFGFTAQEAIGRPHPVVPRSEAVHFRRHCDELLAGRVVFGVEGVRQRKDGTQIQVRFSGAPLVGHDGAVDGVMYAVEDITDEKLAAEQLQHAQKMEVAGQLTGGLAHDFNNHLGVIIGNLDLLADEVRGNAEQHAMVQDSLSAALKGAELTRSLLAFARRQPLQMRTIDPRAAIDGMATLLRRTLGEQFTVAIHNPSDLWPVTADPAQLETAILNLCLNARDAMPNGGTLTIETRTAHLDDAYAARHAEVQAGDYVQISITDTGAGMPKEVLARALDPFFTTKEIGKGSGLGLSMVYGFVKQCGGHFKLYSEVDHGTTATIYLPRAASADLSQSSTRTALMPRAPGGEAILVVDDNDQLRKVMAKQLRELGYATIEAADGPDALRTLSNGAKADLLFTDVVMPNGMNGYDLADSARALRPDLKVLFTSGFPEVAEINAGRLPANAAMLTKPVLRRDLARRLREIFDESKERKHG